LASLAVGAVPAAAALQDPQAVRPALLAVPADSPWALVLGAGGSRGLAHAGVVEGLDQLRRDPELVVGASMGAIVGALYASGITGVEIRREVAHMPWPELFSGRQLPLGLERRERAPIVELDVERQRFTQGLIHDWRINRTLAHLLFDAGVRAGGDFDRLPRRFRAVAADITTGNAVVLARGDLARAVRASMAVPGVFGVVAWGGTGLVDGGVASYLPVAVAQQLGAATVVAVDVIRPDPQLMEARPVNLGLRGLRLILLNTLDGQEPPDILLLPRIGQGIPEAVFPAAPEPLLRAGRAAVLERITLAPRPPAPRLPAPPPAGFTRLTVHAEDPGVARLVEAAYRYSLDAPYDPAAVLRATDRLYATGLFRGVWPSTAPWPEEPDDGGTGPGAAAAGGPAAPPLIVRVETRAPAALAAAAGFDEDRGGRAWAQVEGWTGVAGPAEVTLAGSLHALERLAAAAVRVHSRAFVPLAWTAGVQLARRDSRIFEDRAPVATTTVQRSGAWAGLEIPAVFPERLAALTLAAENVRIEEAAADATAQAEGWASGPLLRIGTTPRPNQIVGGGTGIEAEARFGDVEYRRLRLLGTRERRIGVLRTAAVAELAGSWGAAPPDARHALGDEARMPGMRWGEGRGDAVALAGADVAYPVVFEGFLRVRLRAGLVAQRPGRLGDREQARMTGAELAGIWTTPVGPVLVAMGAHTAGGRRLRISVGPDF
jgi:predicted acylesterase/phospholipase RssA